MQPRPTVNHSGREDGFPLTAVRLRARQLMPYVARALYAAPLVPVPGLRQKSGGWACDEFGRVFYDPIMLTTETLDALAADLLHEVAGHILRRHAIRFKRLPVMNGMKPDHQRWNKAGDCEINDDRVLKENLQGWCVFPHKLGLPEGKLAEWYYVNLPEDDEGGDDGGGQPGDEPGEGDGQGQGQPGGCDCGSGAGGPEREWELGPPDPDADPDSPEAQGMSEGELEAIRQHVAEEVRKHVQQNGIGSVSVEWQEWANETLAPPTIPWQQTLSRIVRASIEMSAGAEDYTYRKINRRQSALGGIILPAMYKPKIEIALVLDTSGSMSNQMVESGLSEINGICRAVGSSVTVFCCDTSAGAAQKVANASRVEIDRRGGTDMRVGIEAALKSTPRPHVIIVVTDCETDWPRKRCPVPLVVCAVGKSSWIERVPSWAKTVQIED